MGDGDKFTAQNFNTNLYGGTVKPLVELKKAQTNFKNRGFRFSGWFRIELLPTDGKPENHILAGFWKVFVMIDFFGQPEKIR